MEEQHVYTEEEIKQVTELLNNGISPVAHHELDELIKMVDILTETVTRVWANKQLGKEDFPNFQALWDQAWVIKEKFQAIEQEAKSLGLFSKISLVIRGFVAINKLFKAISKS